MLRYYHKIIAAVLSVAIAFGLAAPAYATGITDGFVIENGVLTAYTGDDTVVKVPDSVTAIAYGAFRNNTTMTELYLGKNVVSIDNNIVYGATALTTLHLPDGDTPVEVGGSAFSGCENLTTLVLGPSVVSVAENFLNISTLQQIVADPKNTWYYSRDGVLFKRESSATDLTLVRMPGNSPITDYTVPSDCYVTAIGKYAFYYCNNLTSVEIAAGVKEIRYEAFSRCSNLKSIDMGPDVQELDDYALYYCTALESLTLSPALDDVLTSTAGTLSGSPLKTLIVPKNAAFIPENMMFKDSLTEIIVEDGNPVFTSVDGVLYTADPRNANATGDTLLAYPRAKADESYSILEGTKTVGNDAFRDNKLLTKVTMPESLEVIKQAAFAYCHGLTEIVLGKNVNTLEYDAFYGCNNMTSLTLSEKLTAETVNNSVVGACNKLTTLYVPAAAEFVPNSIAKFSALTEIVVEDGNSRYFSDHGVLYERTEEDGQLLHTYPRAKADEGYAILEGTKTVGKDAFRDNKLLTKVTMPESLEVIRQAAFAYCYGLTEIVLGKNVTTLEYDAFYGCNNMTSFTLSEKLTVETVNNSVVGACNKLTTLYVPATAEFVPNSIAKFSALTEIVVEDGNSRYFSDYGVLYKRTEEDGQLLHTYPRAKADEGYAILEGTKTVDKDAFRDNKLLTKVTMPESLEVIRQAAFAYCYGLTEIVLGKNVTTLEYDAFYHCNNMTSFTLSKKLTAETVNNSVVGWCDKLTTLYVPAAAEYTPPSLYRHSALENIFVIDEAGKRDAVGVAYSSSDGVLFSADGTTLIQIPTAKQITEYVIPETVTVIGERAAYDHKYLASVSIPANVTEIGRSAFEYCDELMLIMARGCTPETVGSYALDANKNVAIVCDEGSSLVDHAIYHKLIYVTGGNLITAKVEKKLTGSDGYIEDTLSSYRVSVFLGDNGTAEEYEFPAYTAGEYILIPAEKTAKNGESIKDYSKVTVRLISKTGECEESVTLVELDEDKCAEVTLRAAQKGYVTGTVTAQSRATVAIYDSEGVLIQTMNLNSGKYTSDYIPAGDYTVVALQGKVRNWIQNSLSDYETLGMQEGSDYVKTSVKLVNGEIAVQDITISNESSYASVWLDEGKTSYLLLDSEVTASGRIDFRLCYSLKEEFKDYALSGKEIVITIPQGLLVSEESVTLDGASASDTELTDSELRIKITENSGTVQFSASPTAYGLIVSSASFCFNYAGVSYREFAGSISTTVEYVTIEVPTTTSTQSILVQGVTVPGASVTVYDGEWVIGRATAYESGRWAALVELSGNDPDALHLISASVSIEGETKTTAQYEILWADDLTNIKNLHMYYQGRKYVIKSDGTVEPTPVTFSPYDSDYMFHVQLENDENVESVYLTDNREDLSACYMGTNDENGWWVINATYDTIMYIWNIDNYDYPGQRVGNVIFGGGRSWSGDKYFPMEYLIIPPGPFSIGFINKPLDETVNNDIIDKYTNLDPEVMKEEMSDMPEMWQNATGRVNSDTRDSEGYGVLDFEIDLNNEAEASLHYKITAARDASVTRAQLDADESFTKSVDGEGNTVYTSYYYEETDYYKSLVSGGDETASAYSGRRGGSSSNALMKMGSTSYEFPAGVEEGAKIVSTEVIGWAAGEISESFGKQVGGAAAVFGVYSDVTEVGNNMVSLWGARQAIINSGMSQSAIDARLQALDRLTMGYMICAGLRYATTVMGVGMLLTGGVPFMAGLAVAGLIAMMNAYVNQTLNDCLSNLLDFSLPWIIDPSGYVYEAVTDNRVEGATAKVYYQDENTGEAVLWKAEEYDQINPQITNEEGIFAWDVPNGMWKVVVEKEGYESVESEWLSVPPPQVNVYLSMVSTQAPTVTSVHLYKDTAVIEFSQYMKIDSVTADTFSMNGSAAVGKVEAIDPKESAVDSGEMLARQFKLHYSGGKVTSITVSAEVLNYVGAAMEKNVVFDNLITEYETEGLAGDGKVYVVCGQEIIYQLQVLPAEAAASVKLFYKISDSYNVAITDIGEPDANGVIPIKILGNLPTTAAIDIYVEGSTISKRIEVQVTEKLPDGGEETTAREDVTIEGPSESNIAEPETSAEDTDITDEPKENNATFLWIAVGLMAAAAILAVVLAFAMKKRKKIE